MSQIYPIQRDYIALLRLLRCILSDNGIKEFCIYKYVLAIRISLLNRIIIKLYDKLVFELEVNVRDEMYEKLFYFHRGFEIHIHRATFMLITEYTYLCSPVLLSWITYSARNLQRKYSNLHARFGHLFQSRTVSYP